MCPSLLGRPRKSLQIPQTCRFSQKIYKALRSTIIPALNEKLPNQYEFIFRHQVQPWHPSSVLVHEAALAVSLLAPEKFWDFSDALFEASPQFYDEPVYNESRPQTYQRLAQLAYESVGVSKEEFLKLVDVPASEVPKNGGNSLQADVKYFVKQSRQNGVHVSPTVFVNGVVDSSIESSSTTEFWLQKAEALSIAK